MSNFIEFHLIQNFAPSNLNRDDTGAPKDAIFGGHRRARISSQCIKRSIRNAPEMKEIPPECNSVRTKKIVSLLEARLGELGHPNSKHQIITALSAVKLKVDETDAKSQTETLLFLGEKEINGLAELIIKYWDKLGNGAESSEDGKLDKKARKKKVEKDIPGLSKDIKNLLNGQKSVDIALYGRMLADMPEANQYAACQVAHAISTHSVDREFDYYSAIDDYKDSSEQGAGMIGHLEFNSATYYRFAVIDVNKLVSNLCGDKELVLESVRAFAKAIVKSIPTGKQNSFAAHNLPVFVGITLRTGCPRNLVNAFEKPIRVFANSGENGISEQSVQRLANQETLLSKAYGNDNDAWGVLDLSKQWSEKIGSSYESLDELSNWLVTSLRKQLEA